MRFTYPTYNSIIQSYLFRGFRRALRFSTDMSSQRRDYGVLVSTNCYIWVRGKCQDKFEPNSNSAIAKIELHKPNLLMSDQWPGIQSVNLGKL